MASIDGRSPRFVLRLLLCGLLGLSLSSTLAEAADVRLYRYTNDDGNTVIDDRVPNEYVARGYEVINARGVVLEVVPPAMSLEERAAAEREKAAGEAARKRDEDLLLRYSEVAEIEAAKQRRLENLDIRINILESTRKALANQMASLQKQAADLERRDREVDSSILEAMEDVREELLKTEGQLAQREAEYDETVAAFDSDIARFRELLSAD